MGTFQFLVFPFYLETHQHKQ